MSSLLAPSLPEIDIFSLSLDVFQENSLDLCEVALSVTCSVSLTFCVALPASFLVCTEDFSLRVLVIGAVDGSKLEATVTPSKGAKQTCGVCLLGSSDAFTTRDALSIIDNNEVERDCFGLQILGLMDMDRLSWRSGSMGLTREISDNI